MRTSTRTSRVIRTPSTPALATAERNSSSGTLPSRAISWYPGTAWTPAADADLRHALEVRHASFSDPGFLELMSRHQVAVVVADSAGRYPAISAVTSDHVYVRLHGAEELYVSGYDDRALDRWAAAISEWADSGLDVFVYFDNDAKGYAPWDALRLRDRLTSYLP